MLQNPLLPFYTSFAARPTKRLFQDATGPKPKILPKSAFPPIIQKENLQSGLDFAGLKGLARLISENQTGLLRLVRRFPLTLGQNLLNQLGQASDLFL